jgi:hypothetical protein
MATKTRIGTHRQRRRRHLVRVVRGSWLIVLVSHTIATIVMMIVNRLLHVWPSSGP